MASISAAALATAHRDGHQRTVDRRPVQLATMRLEYAPASSISNISLVAASQLLVMARLRSRPLDGPACS
jgi:hypothetical protein